MPTGELMLAAMVDMMMNLLIFLITLYGTDPIEIEPSPELILPRSTAERPIQAAPVLRVTTRQVALGSTVIASLTEGADGPALPAGVMEGGRLPDLERELKALAEAAGPLAEASQTRAIDIQCDKRVSWDVLGPLVETAGRAGFGDFRFIVRTSTEN
jgi:biopolymer transport protein ExbD